jgi:hypothetical protein
MADDHDRSRIRKALYDAAIEGLVHKMRRDDPQLSESDATARVFREDPELYERYRHLSYISTR